MRPLALLIRSPLVDRINNRRRVPLDDHRTGNRFFDDLSSRENRENSDRPLRDLHADVRKEWESAGCFLPLESDVMCAIEILNNSARSEQPTTQAPGEVFPEYAVLTADLARVIRAFDDDGLGNPMSNNGDHNSLAATRTVTIPPTTPQRYTLLLVSSRATWSGCMRKT